jgi:hypothetical protein
MGLGEGPLGYFLTCTLLLRPFAADGERRQEDRVKASGVVLKEIFNIPNDSPQHLLDGAEWF